MIVHYRLIKYEAQSKEDLEFQLENSLANGVYPIRPGRLTISIRDLNMPVVDDPHFWKELPVRPEGCITQRQLKDLEEPKEG